MVTTQHFKLLGFLFFGVVALSRVGAPVERNDFLKNSKLQFLALVAACTLSLASFASGSAPCKSGQKMVGHACAPVAKAKSASAAKAKPAGVSRSKAKPKTRARTKPIGRTKPIARKSIIAAARMPVASELPAADVDCSSTQSVLQGGVAQCPATASPSGSVLATLPQANPGTACFAALAGSNASRQLASRVPFLSASAASSAALANRGLPNRMEKEELGSVMAGYAMCLDMAVSWRRETYAPAVVQALDAYWLSAQSILRELAGGKRSFGDAAKAIAQNDKSYKVQLGAMNKDL